jgi:hypothetical protein
MNNPDSPHPAEVCLQQLLEKAEIYVRREPSKAVAAAFGAGILLKLLPTRAIVRPLATLGVLLLPSALLGLGLLKALEICFQQPPCNAQMKVIHEMTPPDPP